MILSSWLTTVSNRIRNASARRRLSRKYKGNRYARPAGVMGRSTSYARPSGDIRESLWHTFDVAPRFHRDSRRFQRQAWNTSDVATMTERLEDRTLLAAFYWDTNGDTPGFGTASGTWAAPTPGPTIGWSTDSTGASVIGSITTTTSDDVYFGFDGGGAGGGALGSGTVTVTGTQSVNDIRFGYSSGAITLSGGTIDMDGGEDLIRAEAGGGTATSTHTIDSNITKSSGSIRIGTQNTNNERYILNGELSGNFSLDGRIQNNTGVVTLNGLNTFTGNASLVTGQYNVNTLVDSGTASSLGAGNTISMGGGGAQQPRLVYTGGSATSTNRTFRLNSTDNNGNIAQNGALDLAGSVTTTGGGTYPLQLTGTADTGTNTVSGVISDGSGTVNVRVRNFGAVGVTGEAGYWQFTGANTYTGSTSIQESSTLQLGDGGTTGSLSTSSAITVNAGSSFIVDQNDTVSQGTDFSDSLNGDGDVIMNGSGTLELKIKGGYAGNTTVDSGILRLVNTTDLAGMTSDNFFINNGSTLEIESSVGGPNRSTLLNDSVFTFDNNGGGNINFVSGNHLAQTGSSGTAQFITTGGTKNTITSSAGFINPQGSGNHVTFAVADGSDDVDLEVSVNISNGTWRKDGAGTLSIISNNNSQVNSNGSIIINDGTFEIGGSGRIRSTGQTSGVVASAITNSGVFKHNSTANQSVSGDISGTGSLEKDNTGTLTLTGNNNYTGATTVNGGTLVVNGATASGSSVTVNNGGTLGGSGTVGGSVTTASGGTVAPGNSPGILSTGAFSLVAGSSLDIEFDGGTTAGTNYDQVAVTGTVTLGGALNLLDISGGMDPAAGDEFVILSNDGTDAIIGTFNGLVEGAIVSTDFGGSGLTARVTYIGGFGGNDAVIVVDGGTVEVPVNPGNVDDNYTVQVSGGNLQVLRDGVIVTSVPVASGNVVVIDGSDGNDTLTIDDTNDIPAAGIRFNGGAGTDDIEIAIAGVDNTIRLNGTGSEGLQASSGHLTIDGKVVEFNEVEQTNTITITGTNNLTVDITGAGDITFTRENATQTRVTQAGGDSFVFDSPTGILNVDLDNTARNITFTDMADDFNPTNGIDIDGGNAADTVVVTSLGAAFTARELDFQLGGGTDSITINDTLTLSTVDFRAETIAQGAAISVTGTTNLDAGAAGTITLTNPANDFGGVVTVTNAATLDLVDANSLGIDTITATSAFLQALAGSITDGLAGEAANITATSVALRATTGIGDLAADDNDIDISATNLAATTATGDISITDFGALNVTTVDGLTGIAITTGGAGDDILLRDGTVGGTELLDIQQTVSNAGAGNITVFANGNADGDQLQVSTNGDITATGGNITLVSFGDVDFNGSPIVSTTGTGTINVHAGATINFAGAVTTTGGDADSDIDAGADYSLRTNEGNITVTAPDNVAVEVINADFDAAGGAGTVIITADVDASGAGAITDNVAGDGAALVTGAAAVFRAANGIGSGDALETAVSNLAFSNTTSGNVELDNTGGLTIASVDGQATSSNVGTGTTTISASGPVTFAVNTSSGGNLTANATEDAGALATDDVTVNAGVTVQSTAGDVTFNAGDDIVITATGVVQATAANGDVTLNSGVADNDNVGTQTLDGTVSANTTNGVVTLDLNADGSATQAGTGTITANGLRLLGTGADGSFALATSTTNDVNTVAAATTGAINLRDDDGLTVGTVGGTVGITTSDDAVTIESSNGAGGAITVSQAITTAGAGTTGTVELNGNVLVNASLTAAGGAITLNGQNAATSDLVINAAVTSAATINWTVQRDIIINAVVQATAAGSDIILTADSDDLPATGVAAGGVQVTTAGQINANDEVTIQGSDLFVTGAAVDSVEIQADGANAQVTAGGNIGIASKTNPATADVRIAGIVQSTGTGNVTITANNDLVITTDGDVTSAGGTLDLNGGRDILIDGAAAGHDDRGWNDRRGRRSSDQHFRHEHAGSDRQWQHRPAGQRWRRRPEPSMASLSTMRRLRVQTATFH